MGRGGPRPPGVLPVQGTCATVTGMKITLVFETHAAYDASVAQMAAGDTARRLSAQLHQPVKLVLAEAIDDTVPEPVDEEAAERRRLADEAHAQMVKDALAAASERVADVKAEEVKRAREDAAIRQANAEAQAAEEAEAARKHQEALEKASAPRPRPNKTAGRGPAKK